MFPCARIPTTATATTVPHATFAFAIIYQSTIIITTTATTTATTTNTTITIHPAC